MKETDTVKLVFKDNSDIVSVILEDSDRKNKYQLKLLDVDVERLDMSADMDHQILITTSKTALTKILQDVKGLDADETLFTINGDRVCITAKNDSCSLKIKPSNELLNVQTPTDEPVTAKFSSRYIQHIHKMLAISKPRMMLRLDPENPLYIVMNMRADDQVGGLSNIQSKIKYYLAPKIDDN